MATLAARREAHERRPATEASRSVLARLFADVLPSSPLHSAVSRLTVDAALDSPRKELSTDGAPMSWPRAHSSRHQTNNSSCQSPPPPCAARVQYNLFESPGTPRSDSSDFQQQLQEQQQQRFLYKATEKQRHRHHHHHKHPEAEAEPQDEVSELRERVALLLKNLEDEKKRRMVEQKLMQEKIIELQGLIRRNFPEQQKAQERRLVQMRSPSASRTKLLRPSSKHSIKAQLSLSRKSSKSSDVGGASEEGDENNQPSQLQQQRRHSERASSSSNNDVKPDLKRTASSPAGRTAREDAKAVETRMKRQLTKMRARMQGMVTDAQLETQSLRAQLLSEKQIHDRKERQLRVETNAKLFASEERHAAAKKRLSDKVAHLSSSVNQLLGENDMLAQQLKEKEARISHLELAMGGKLIAQSSFPNHHQQQRQ